MNCKLTRQNIEPLFSYLKLLLKGLETKGSQEIHAKSF